MTNDKVLEGKVLAVIGRMFKKDPQLLGRETQMMRDLLAKSMNLLELSALLEAEFGIELQTQEMMKAKTAGDIIDLVVAAK
jgi:acyl carrier protein